VEVGPRAAQVARQRPEVSQRLGCALALERPQPVVEQSFEGGMMLSLPDRREIDVLFANGRWATYQDSSQPGASPSPTSSSSRAPGKTFGKVWLERLDVRGPLGAPTGAEVSRLGYVQTFARGTVLSTDTSTTYVLLDDKTWQRVGSASPTATAQTTPRQRVTGTPSPSATATASATPSPATTATATATSRTPTATPSKAIQKTPTP
jgi:hypothetical protein